MEEQLIELVRQNEALYNTKSKLYRDQNIRTQAWEDISKELDVSVAKCRDTWSKLRNCFCNAIKRQRRKYGDGTELKYYTWKHERQMSYLIPYMERRNTTSYLNTMDSQEGDSHSPGNTSAMDNSQEGQSFSVADFPTNDNAHETTMDPFTSNVPESNGSGYNPYKRRALSPYRYLEDEGKPMSAYNEMDEIDLFFLSMSKSLKKLPKLDQMKIKMNLHKALADCELRELQRNETNEPEDPRPECKNRWVSLRDQLRKAMNKRKRREQAGESTKLWKYEENMSFLLPFLKERDPQSRISAAEYLYVSDEESSMSKVDEVYVAMDDSEATEEVGGGNGQNDPKRRKMANSPVGNPSENGSSMPFSSYSRLNQDHTCETTLLALKKFIIESNGKETSAVALSETANVHPVDAFFKGLAATVKQFSSFYQNVAESRLFKIVSDLELCHIQNLPLNFPALQHQHNVAVLPLSNNSCQVKPIKEEPASQTENCLAVENNTFSLTDLCETSLAVPEEKMNIQPVKQNKLNTAKRKSEALETELPNRSTTYRESMESKEDIFAKFIASELKQITDNKIYNETKWKIQVDLMDGINKQSQTSSGS